jgi:hypothetical protein
MTVFYTLIMRINSILHVTAFFVLTVAAAHAGGSFGPAPFKNGSPLTSGTDGVYQCVATGKNATGIISWAISNGVQTGLTSGNSWTFFVDGQTLGGTTSVNVSDGKVAGILDSGISSSIDSGGGETTLPIITVIPGNSGSGTFRGKIDLNSPVAAIDGKGLLEGVADRDDVLLVVYQETITLPNGTVIRGDVIVDPTPITVPGSTLEKVNFKLRGSRLATNPSSFISQNTNTTNLNTNTTN